MDSGIMKSVLLTVMLVSSLAAEESDAVQRVWRAAAERNSSALQVLRNGSTSQKISRETVLSQTSLTVDNVYETDYRQNQKITPRVVCSRPYWDISGSMYDRVNAEETAGSMRISAYPLSSFRQNIALLDSTIVLTEQYEKIQAEQILFSAFKNILNMKIRYETLEYEEKIRQKMDKEGLEFTAVVKKLIENGSVPQNTIHGLNLFLRDNRLRQDALRIEKELLAGSVELESGLDFGTFSALDIRKIFAETDFTKDYSSCGYGWKLDSLSSRISSVSNKRQSMDEWKLSVGCGTALKRTDVSDFENNTFHVTYQRTFKKRSPETVLPAELHTARAVEPSSLETDLSEYEKKTREYSEDAAKWSALTLKRMQLGESGIIHELTSNLSLILGNHLTSNDLRAKFYYQKLQRFQLMNQLPETMRPHELY